ncbi:hypothetical protein [uncultured Aquitalea sp.]|uniref:hypothetical protein n=1 Tax=uncultured Aquitalea sp. TaxID=540272 RepID=UPI0025EB8841|nr:hypothetical protein [uncultured Aquitalea sp.]
MLPYIRKEPLQIVQGCTFTHAWDWFAGGKPVDLTGAEFELVAKLSTDDPNVLLHLTTSNGGIVAGGNTIQLFIDDSGTRQLAWRDAVFDLRIRWPGSEPRRIDPFMSGRITVRPGVLA